jgi:hypothetical protein
MEILVKEFKDENHVYMFDINMRPVNIEVVSKRKTRGYIKNLIKKKCYIEDGNYNDKFFYAKVYKLK